jgi:hypothetical protein
MSYEIGQNIAKNLKQITKDPSEAEPWARYLSSSVLLSVAFFFAYIGFEHDVIFAYIVAAIIALYSYSFAEKEIDSILAVVGTFLKWIIYGAIAFLILAWLFGALAGANPIVLTILFCTWVIVLAIQNKN